MEGINWRQIRAALCAPFDPAEVDFRPSCTPREYQGKHVAPVVAYVDARAVQDRLDDVVGPEHWSFIPQAVATSEGAVTAAIGVLSIFGVPKGDIGDCDATERSKTSVSDSLKRAGVMWGIGRYLYHLPRMYATFEKHNGKDWRLIEGEIEKLRAKLPKAKAPAAESH